MTFYPTDCFEILNFAAKIWVIGRYYNQLPFFYFHTSPWSAGAAAAAAQAFPFTLDFRQRKPELRADLGETVETAPAAHGTDSADTWTSAAPDLSSGAPSREGQGSRRLPDPAPAHGVGASSEDGGRRD